MKSLSYYRNRKNHDTGRIHEASTELAVLECCVQQVSSYTGLSSVKGLPLFLKKIK